MGAWFLPGYGGPGTCQVTWGLEVLPGAEREIGVRVGGRPNGSYNLGERGRLAFVSGGDPSGPTDLGRMGYWRLCLGGTLVVLLTWGEWGIGVRVWGVP